MSDPAMTYPEQLLLEQVGSRFLSREEFLAWHSLWERRIDLYFRGRVPAQPSVVEGRTAEPYDYPTAIVGPGIALTEAPIVKGLCAFCCSEGDLRLVVVGRGLRLMCARCSLLQNARADAQEP